MKHLASIGSQEVQRMVQFRAKPGSALLCAIEEAVACEKIHCGVIVSGLGALQKAVFRNLRHFPDEFPVKPRDRLYLAVSRPMELVSLTGWIAPQENGETVVHAHFSASMVQNNTVVTLGGHLNHETICGIKVVVAILALDPQGVRAAEDPATRSNDIFFGPQAGLAHG